MSTASTQTLSQLAERYWQFLREENPPIALSAGQPHGDELLRESPEDHARRARACQGFLDELAPTDANALTPADRATLLLMRHELTLAIEGYNIDAHLRPSLFPLGPEFVLAYVANTMALLSVVDAEAWLARLASVPKGLTGLQALLRAGLGAGIRTPHIVLERALGNVRGQLTPDPSASPFHSPFLRAKGRDAGIDALAERSLVLVRDHVFPALVGYAQFIEQVLMPQARDSLACSDAPHGQAFYAHLIRRYATVDDSPETIHALGLAEVGRLEAETAAVAAAAGFPNDLAGFRASLKLPDQFAASGEALREQIEVLHKRIEAKLPAFIGNLPRITYGVQSIPEAVAHRMPPAYAQPNPADRTAPGVHWLTSIPTMCPRYMHIPLALHEAWPGHLMHLALIQEQEHLPAFRRYGALGYSACIEGWALYCERLGEEMSLYDTPQKRYGPIEMEMWRAVRLVVDTGLHAKGWTRQQAIDFAAAHLALPMATIEVEIDRYIAMPAQALAYQLGNLKIRALRKKAHQRLGERFKLRDFHDALMACGPVTLPILEALMLDWVEKQAAADPAHARR
ncbi:MAG: DUF885 domain-containing protein [Acetobacteraceae bacterium]